MIFADRFWFAMARRGFILCYHGLTSGDNPSESVVNVPATEFEQLLDRLLARFHAVPLGELLKRHRAGRSTRGLFGVTFDDGYKSVLDLGRPFIARRNIPVTVFVASDAAAEGRSLWWDRIDDLRPRVPPGRWRAFEDSLGLPEEYRVGQPKDFGPLRPLRQWLLRSRLGRSTRELEAALSELELECGFRTTQRPMSWVELLELGRVPGVDFGVHTVSHAVLPLLAEEAAVREIAGCFASIGDRLGRCSPVLAAPFGLFDGRTAPEAQAAGITWTLTLDNRPLRFDARDPLVPRISITRRLTSRRLALRLAGVQRPGSRWPALPSATS